MAIDLAVDGELRVCRDGHLEGFGLFLGWDEHREDAVLVVRPHVCRVEGSAKMQLPAVLAGWAFADELVDTFCVFPMAFNGDSED